MSLDHRLRQQFLDAERQMPHSSVDWATTIARGKRERMYRTALVAAAAVLFIGGGALSAQGLLESNPAPLPAPAGTLTEQPTPQESPTGDVSEGIDPTLARQSLLDWVKALSLGDAPAAWDLMSQPSKEYYGSLSSFKTDAMPELTEGWGAWHSGASSPQTDVRVLASSGDGAIGVITIYGEVTKEGITEYAANSVAFRISGDVALIEPYSSKIEIQPIEPSFNEEYTDSTLPEEFRAEVPSDVVQVNFFVEGIEHDGRLANIEEKEQKGSQPPNSIASAQVPDGIPSGPHFVTIAAVDVNGEVAVEIVPIVMLD